MAGRVRQPVDEAALERYISDNVPAIKTPIDLKQVSSRPSFDYGNGCDADHVTSISSALVNPTPRTRSRPLMVSAS